ESEEIDLAAVEARYRLFVELLGKDRVGLVHGKLKSEEKEAALQRFASAIPSPLAGESGMLLVATTVVEVGVNVPDATVIVIEHAERFGLAQLHQLRGRVGRGEKPSSCILLYADSIGETGKERLKAIRASENGFQLAEDDLRIRGGGDLLGTRQSGLPEWKFADLATHQELIRIAHDDVRLILNKDPKLAGDRGKALRTLLYLHDYDTMIRTLEAG
ncbi:MAG: ATP-dependent DNA helicase RecG, partial [Alphaproteobacteria bacterium]|nr:ATP-dependent DNA helicase RecG [Alphaproteobacteria bacterium]